MEENLNIEISETNRGKKQIILNKKYKYNFSKKKKDNTDVYRCTEYKTLNKCKSFINLNDKNEVLDYECSHNHPEKEIEVSISLVKHKIKDKIRKSSISSDLKTKRIFDEISQEVGYECPEYKKIKTQIRRYKNKRLFPNIKTLDKVPKESEYYNTKRGKILMIFKNSDIIIFQSKFQAKLFAKNKHIFADGTFSIAPPGTNQVFITRTFDTEVNRFYTTSISILISKEQNLYKILLEEIKKNIIKYNPNVDFSEKLFHCDFEKGITNAVENVFPNMNIKYCVWHYKRLLRNKKKICYKEVKDNNILKSYYKAISNLPFINPQYIYDIFYKIKFTCEGYGSTCTQFLKFLDYFEKTFLKNYNIKYWNYYNKIEHTTNNASESYNKRLKKSVNIKPSFFELIYTIQNEESISYYDHKRRILGIWEIESRISDGEEKINNIIEYYKYMEAKLKNIGSDKNDIIDNWFNCLIRLNNKSTESKS